MHCLHSGAVGHHVGWGNTGPLMSRRATSPVLFSGSHLLSSPGYRPSGSLLWGLHTYLGASSTFSPPVKVGPKWAGSRVQSSLTAVTDLEPHLQTPFPPSVPEGVFSSLNGQKVTGGLRPPPNLSMLHLGRGSQT